MRYLVWSYDSFTAYGEQAVVPTRCDCDPASQGHFFYSVELTQEEADALGPPGRGSPSVHLGTGRLFVSDSNCKVVDPVSGESVRTSKPPQTPPPWWS